MAGQPGEIHFDGRPQKDVQGVFGSAAFAARRDFHDILRAVDEPFGQQEARCQFSIVARRAHRDRNAAPTDANFQRLLPGQRIGLAGGLPTDPAALDFPEDGCGASGAVFGQVSFF